MKPLFRDPGEGDEREDGYSEPFGFLLGPMGVFSRDEMADQYFRAANLIVEQIQEGRIADFEIAYPVLYLYRHSMELLLKCLIGGHSYTHRLDQLVGELVRSMRDRYGEEVPAWMIGRLEELAQIDPTSQAFRYGEDNYPGRNGRSGVPAETYVRVLELHSEMNRLYQVLRRALLITQGKNPDSIR